MYMTSNLSYSEKGYCFWVTGLSGAGKTTVCNALSKKFEENNIKVILLDGDVMRHILQSNGNSRSERIRRGYTYSHLCKLLSEQRFIVIIGVIGLFHELHEWNKKNIKNYIEVFLDVPMVELEKRNSKGIYKKAREGNLRNIAGVDLKVEFPLKPAFHFKFNSINTPEHMAETLYNHYKLQNKM